MQPMGRPENAIARVVTGFKECLSENEVLRRIDDLFGDLGFEFDPDAEERSLARGVGQRRSRAEGYLATLDLSKADDRERLFEAIAAKLHDWGDDPQWERLTRLHRTLKTAGYEWNGRSIVPRPKPEKESTSARPAPVSGPAPPSQPDPTVTGPSVFISYAHEDKELVMRLAAALRARGCRVWIDQGEMRVGDHLIDRVAGAIEEMDFLLAILSEAAVKSPWCQRELSLAMSGELEKARIKVLPVRIGSVVLPPTLKGVYSPKVDPGDIDAMADKLVADMTSHRTGRGGPPALLALEAMATPTAVPAAPANPPKVDPDEPIKILGIDEPNVGRPRNDGSRGSALYKVPLRLNRRPSPLWAEAFRSVWDRPPQFTTMHRPGIASVSGDRIILDGTTVDEIERYHAETLRHVIREVNRRVADVVADERAKREREEA
ncbi:MAG TPA: toll/interleukin-1 receptor domain-containing protein, partial [Candidatus Limnocylindrales bacterium]|nr:toll/interleukin-1 receptor domain-containing protein [Candidatus Limnocylindrales bacterium]